MIITESDIKCIIYNNTSRDYYTKQVRGIYYAAKVLAEKTNLNVDLIKDILNSELRGDYYSGSVRNISYATERIFNLLNK